MGDLKIEAISTPRERKDFVDLAFEGQKLLYGHTIRPLRC